MDSARLPIAATWLALSAVAAADDPAAATPVYSVSEAVQFVDSYCVDCHSADAPESGLDLEAFASLDDLTSSIDTWQRIAQRVSLRQMPPLNMEQPEDAARAAFVTWIHDSVFQHVCAAGPQPGDRRLRRLNREEYANTVRDLLGVHVNSAHALPADGAGGEGFDNAAETLFISPIHAEKFLDAAETALDYALKDTRTFKRLVVAEPSDETPASEAARRVLTEFLPRAFRRPAGDEEINDYTRLFEDAYAQNPRYAAALKTAMTGVMVSPKFLFLAEEPNEGPSPLPLTQHELASRLSYFLWSSMPDEELSRLAVEGRLHEPDVLAEQVVRMLRSEASKKGFRRDAKVREFARSFMEQWLGTRALGREFVPDASVSPDYDSELEGGLKYEPIFFLEDLLADNGSLLALIDSDFTYANRRLARHYGIEGQFREQPRRVKLTDGDRRGGLLGMGAVLAVSSYAHRTSPVLRGKWVLETLLGTPPPPPPPDVPELDEANHAAQPESLRERLERHRQDPTCASCHAAMDPLGFGLENYGVLGQWRDEADGLPIDATGELPDGTGFDGPAELKALLMQRKAQFLRNLTAKVLGYALSRGLTEHDACVVEQIAQTVEQDDYRAQTLVVEVVKSMPFRYKAGTGQAPDTTDEAPHSASSE